MRSNKTPRSNHDPHIKIQFASCKLPLLLIKNIQTELFQTLHGTATNKIQQCTHKRMAVDY